MASKNKKSIEFEVAMLAMVIVILSYLAIVYIVLSGRRGVVRSSIIASPAPSETRQLPEAVATPTYAPSGSVVKGFPQDMIIDAKAKIANSYALSYSASLNQYTAI